MTSKTETEITADIVGAYVRNNHITPAELITLIAQVHQTVRELGQLSEHLEAEGPTKKQKPAVPIKKSQREDKLICLECG